MEEALRAKLLETAALTAIVGQRVQWGERPEIPGVRLSGISGVVGMNYSGPDGWTRSRVQVDAWARTYAVSRNIGNVIGGTSGVLTAWRETRGGVRLRTFVVGRRTAQDSDEVGPLHLASLDVMVWHQS